MAYLTARAVTNGQGYTIGSSGYDIHNLRTNVNSSKNQEKIWECEVERSTETTLQQIFDLGTLPRKILERMNALWVYKYSQLACGLCAHGANNRVKVAVCLSPARVKSLVYKNTEYRIRGGVIYKRNVTEK